jgi:hypothetical protein
MRKTALLVLAFALIGGVVAAQSSPPERLSYQGVLRTNAGAPFSGNVDMTFRIYTTATGGTAIWEEVYDDAAAPPANHNVTVTNGLFSVQLGDYEHVPTYTGSFGEVFTRTDLWLGVQVATDLEMTPRVKIASSGFALNSSSLAGKPASRYADTQWENIFSYDQATPITLWPATTPPFGNFRLLDLKKAQPDATSVFYADIDGDVTQAGTLLIRPLTAPTANTKMIDLKSNLGVTLFSVDSEGDLFASSLPSHNQDASTISTGTLGVARGGTGLAAPGASGNVLTSNGTAWVSSAPGSNTNADTLDGFHANYFLDTSSASQTKTGRLVVNNVSPGDWGLMSYGLGGGGYFTNSTSGAEARAYLGPYYDDGSGPADAGYYGVVGVGTVSGGHFKDAEGTGYSNVGFGNRGIEARGSEAGGYFKDWDGSGYAYAGYGDVGVHAEGDSAGGFFKDANNSGQAYVGTLDTGIEAAGNSAGGTFRDSDGTGRASVALGDTGIVATGDVQGGYFQNTFDVGTKAYLARASATDGLWGIRAFGTHGGGFFSDSTGASEVYVGTSITGVSAWAMYPGSFVNSNGQLSAYLAYSDQAGRFVNSGTSSGARIGTDTSEGIGGWGCSSGGYFFLENNPATEARLAYDDPGTGSTAWGRYGVQARGERAGGYFEDLDTTSHSYLGYGKYGIYAKGVFSYTPGDFLTVGGLFEVGAQEAAYAAYSLTDLANPLSYGIWAHGETAGGKFQDIDLSGVSAEVAIDTYKIQSTGTSAFIQNHPTEKDQVIVYASPEGDEVATYTRGSARLAGGAARVSLGKTFQWVTNPDIGLTAHLTPRGEWADLYVESLTPTDLVVRSKDPSSNALFDYLVYGLRIGFEEISIVQQKRTEAWIPSFASHRERYDKNPELRSFNPLERFKAMETGAGLRSSFDFSSAKALRDAIHEFDPSTDGPSDRPNKRGAAAPTGRECPSAPAPAIEVAPSTADGTERRAEERPVRPLPIDSSTAVPLTKADRFPVAPSVTKGDVLVMIPNNGEELHPCARPADPMVGGIAVTDAADGFAGVASSGYVMVKVDANPAPISRGDLLVASPLPGHAMKAIEATPGTIVGKAFEPLASGTGLIKVLVMMR